MGEGEAETARECNRHGLTGTIQLSRFEASELATIDGYRCSSNECRLLRAQPNSPKVSRRGYCVHHSSRQPIDNARIITWWSFTLMISKVSSLGLPARD